MGGCARSWSVGILERWSVLIWIKQDGLLIQLFELNKSYGNERNIQWIKRATAGSSMAGEIFCWSHDRFFYHGMPRSCCNLLLPDDFAPTRTCSIHGSQYDSKVMEPMPASVKNDPDLKVRRSLMKRPWQMLSFYYHWPWNFPTTLPANMMTSSEMVETS